MLRSRPVVCAGKPERAGLHARAKLRVGTPKLRLEEFLTRVSDVRGVSSFQTRVLGSVDWLH